MNNSLRNNIQDGIAAHAAGSRFGLNSVPRHIHNNVDSPYTFQPILNYIGEVSSTGVKILLSNGWTSTRTGTGTYKVTHNLNTTLYQVAAVVRDSAGVFLSVTDRSKNSFTVSCYTPSGVSYGAANSNFGFVVTVINNRSQTLPTYP